MQDFEVELGALPRTADRTHAVSEGCVSAARRVAATGPADTGRPASDEMVRLALQSVLAGCGQLGEGLRADGDRLRRTEANYRASEAGVLNVLRAVGDRR